MLNQRRSGAFLGYLNIVVKNVVNLIYTPMLLFFVGQIDYGVFQTANNFIISLQLLTFGFSGAYVRFYMRYNSKGDELGIRRLNGMYLILYLIICMIAICLGLLFAKYSPAFFAAGFTSEQGELAARIMVVLTFNVATTLLSTVFDAYIIAHERFVFQQTRQMFTSLATPGLALILLMSGWGVVGVAVAQLMVNIVLLALNAHYAIGKIGMRFEILNHEHGAFKAIAVFSGWVFLNQVFDLMTINAPSVILAAIAGAAPVAVFAIATQLRNIFYLLSTTISNVFVPLINKAVAERDDNTELTQIMARAGRYQALAWWWVLGGFIVTGQWFISVWAGRDFLDAYWLTIAMVVPATVPLVQNTGIEIQKAKNKHKPRSIAYLICAIVDLILTFALSAQYGAWAAAIGYDAYILLGSCLFMNWYYQKRIGLDMVHFWKSVLPVIASCALSSAICLVGVQFAPINGIFGFLLWGMLYTAVSGVVLWVFTLNKSEKARLKGLWAKLVKGVHGE